MIKHFKKNIDSLLRLAKEIFECPHTYTCRRFCWNVVSKDANDFQVSECRITFLILTELFLSVVIASIDNRINYFNS